MKKVVITGGSGFLGLWVAKKLLEHGFQVRIADIQHNYELAHSIIGKNAEQLEWFTTNVVDTENLKTAVLGCTQIIHLAGLLTQQCRDNPSLASQVNFQSLVSLFEIAKELKLNQLIYASTAGVYGPHQTQYPAPETFYGAFKLAAEHVAKAYWTDASPENRISSVGLRPLVIYGPGRLSGVSAGPSVACSKALKQEPYTIPFSGETGFVYVEDISEIILRTLQNPPQGAHYMNLCGVIAPAQAVAQEIMQQTAYPHIHVSGPSLNIQTPPHQLAQYPWLGSMHYTSISEGIKKTLDFERRHYE